MLFDRTMHICQIYVRCFITYWFSYVDANYFFFLSTVTISGTDILRGILLQVKRPETSIPLGSWEDIPSFLQTLRCNGSDNSITHTNNIPKELPFNLTWVAPDEYVGLVQVLWVFPIILRKSHNSHRRRILNPCLLIHQFD